MAQDVIRVLGLAESINNLKKLEERLRNNIVRRAARAAARVYLKNIKGQAYGAGRTRRTGLLQRSPGVSVSKKGDRIVASVKMRGVNVGGQSKFAKGFRKARGITSDAKRKSSAFYWRFLEYGVAKERKTKRGASRGSLSARPWVRPLFNSDSGPAIEAFRTTVQKGLVEEALKLPKTYKNRR